MQLRKFFSVAVFAVFVVFSAQISIFAADRWIKIESKNFRLYGGADEKEMRGAAVKLEQFREAFRQIFPKIKLNSPIPTNVVVFKDNATFRDFQPVEENGKRTEWVAGYFQGGEDVNYIALSMEGEKSAAYHTIFHEYVHFLINNELGQTNLPAWFNEGIAEYYEQLTVENDRKVTLGGLDNDNLRLLQQNKLIPLDTFFNIDNYALHQQGSDGAGLFYAQAWALMHYLIQSNNGARNPQLSKFLNLLLSGKPPKEAFGEAFQTDYAAMEKELKNYVEQRSFRVQTIELKEKLSFDTDLKSAPLTEAGAKATLGDLLLHTNRLAEAEAVLKEALTLDANSAAANATLGIVKCEQKNFGEAKKYLEKANVADAKNYLTHYRLAYVLSREGMTDFGFVSNYNIGQAAKMRDELDASIALNPNFPESYNLYAFVNYVRDEAIDEGIAYLRKAIALAPGNQWYQVRLAELYSRNEDFANARRIAQKIYETAPDEHLRVYAKNTLSQINFYEAQLDSIKNYQPNKSKVTDKILTEEEIARLNEQALLEAVNQALRRPKADEKRVLGYLTKIECGKTVEYTVKVGSQTLKFSSENFDGLFLMTYSAENSGGEIGCGTIRTDVFSVITYRPNANANSKTAGEIVAVEIVPANFVWLK